ncbi:MAG TPA: HEAT repeat domain-containing protein [Polyangiaceae bacterium]|nr:HEAT repeat domain-containing protein [Polyangiaceae bacterium]
MDKLWITTILATSVLLSGISEAAPGNSTFTVPAGPGQAPLCAQLREQSLEIDVCPAGALSTNETSASGQSLSLALPAQAKKISSAILEAAPLGAGRHALHARIPLGDDGSAWEALVASPVDGSNQAKVLWSGITGLVEGELGERHGAMISARDHSLLIGQQREDMQLCGRPTLLSPQVVVAKDLSLHPVKLQQLSAEERQKAVTIAAHRDQQIDRSGSPLHALWASSAIGSPQALTDGNPATFWAENRGADGRGELVVLASTKALAMTSVHLQFHPTGVAPALGAAPKELWLVTDDQLFHVNLPENGWKPDAPSYAVDLPAAVHSSCVALVLEKGFEAKKDTQITISELWANTALGQNWSEIASALDHSDEEARAAADALSYGGEPAFAAAAQAFSSLSVKGQLLALSVLDQASCAVAAPVYWRASKANTADGTELSQKRLQRCKPEVSELLLAELHATEGNQRAALMEQLASIAPALFAEKVAGWLGAGSNKERARLREAVAQVAALTDAQAPLRAALHDEATSKSARLDLLRALAHHTQDFSPEYEQAFRSAVNAATSFDEQYLLLGPASALMAADSSATQLIRSDLVSANQPYLRAEAARRADVRAFAPELVAATRDPEVRVRLAAVESLQGLSAQTTAALLDRLTEDPWPMVRAAAADSLQTSRDPSVDHKIAGALKDDSRHVRRLAAYVLGRRGAHNEQPALRDSLEDEEEDPAVRAAAAVSLGQLCDIQSIDRLTEFAHAVNSGTVTTGQLWLGRAALQALADLHPKDLQQRIAPLLGKATPAEVRRMAREALARPAHCSNASKPKATAR